jgi:hypothetical protein
MKKTLIILLEIFLLAIILLVGANIYYSKPKNCLNCHEISQSYYSWKASPHSSVNCIECHQRRGIMGSIETKVRGIFRVILHFTGIEPSTIKAVVVKEQCWRCHTQVRKKFRLGRTANLSDTHSIHLNRGYNCTDCHKDSVHPSNLQQTGLPKMQACISCHKANEISIKCSTCHLDVKRHQRIIAKLGGMSPDEQKQGCFTCHPSKNNNKSSIDHQQAIDNAGGWKGSTQVCAKCHPQELDDIRHTVHLKLKLPVYDVKGLYGEEQGLLTRRSILFGAKAALNWAYVIEKDEKIYSRGCGKCHISDSLPTDNSHDAEIDCLICHSQIYDMTKRVIVQTETGLKWSWDRSREAAASVGIPSARTCKRCHDRYLRHLRGTPFTDQDSKDAHAAKGMECIQCHAVKNHKIARGNFVTDLLANDLPNVAHSCIQCHMNRRHDNNFINLHLKKIACETCHVKNAGGIVMIDWTEPVDDEGLYDAQKKSDEKITPVFEWFNGKVETSTKPLGSRGDNRAKIYPFKIVRSILPYDPEYKKFLPLKMSVFAQTGDVGASIEAAIKESNQSWSGKWQKKISETYIQISHSVSSTGRQCNECHSAQGIMDFEALGYSREEKESLQRKK